jgi:8-oxo-dGTP diphosphatase
MPYEKSSKLHIVAVVAVIRNSEGKYLILKRHPGEIAYPNMYTFPGGKVEGNDSIEETLVKEVEEEIGLILKPGKILLKDKTFIRPDDQTAKVWSYLCEVVSDLPIKLSSDFTDYKWVNLDELKKLSHVGIEEELERAEQIINSGIDLDKLKTKSVKKDD